MDFQKLLLKICKILENLKILYAITGGYASSVWGRPRSTFDIDVIVELYKSDAHKLVCALKKISDISYIEEDAVIQALEKIGEFNYIDADTGIKVDFYIVGKDQYSKEKLKRRIAKKINVKNIYFVSPEDLILSKLLWYKESSSDRQIEDVKSIIKISGDILDKKYLRSWAHKLKLDDLLNKEI